MPGWRAGECDRCYNRPVGLTTRQMNVRNRNRCGVGLCALFSQGRPGLVSGSNTSAVFFMPEELEREANDGDQDRSRIAQVCRDPQTIRNALVVGELPV